MILPDACILIDYERGKDAKLLGLVRTLPLALCGTARSEFLAGGRTPADRQRQLAQLGLFARCPTPEAVWDEVGENIAVLRTAGLRVPYPDVVLASLGIHLGVEVWSRDAHFSAMQAVLPGLRLFQEPP